MIQRIMVCGFQAIHWLGNLKRLHQPQLHHLHHVKVATLVTSHPLHHPLLRLFVLEHRHACLAARERRKEGKNKPTRWRVKGFRGCRK